MGKLIDIKNEILSSKDGNILNLDPNNWSHVYWWQEDEEIESYMRKNKQTIIDYANLNQKSIKDSVNLLYRLKVANENIEKILPQLWEQAEKNVEEEKKKYYAKYAEVKPIRPMTDEEEKSTYEMLQNWQERD